MDILRNERTTPKSPEAPGPRKEEKPYTTLGKDTEFEGTLRFKEGLRIEGKFNGDISSDGHLIVGETGEVTAEIEIGSIIVEGKINGNIMATELVELRTSAQLRGDITASKLKIDEGVVFIGKSDVQPNNKGKGGGKPAQKTNETQKQKEGGKAENKQEEQKQEANKGEEHKHEEHQHHG